jgi:hypothetical protein
MKIILAVIVLLVLTGCASTDKFDVRVACTLPKDQLLLHSWWGWFAITVKGADKDREMICKP